MTAAEEKIVLDIGSDYRLQLKVKDDDGINDRDLTGWGWAMNIYAKDNATVAAYALTSTFDGGFTGDDLLSGACTVHIDSNVTTGTGSMATGITGPDPFITEYNYVYTLTISGAEGSTSDTNREMRVMRGKLSIRV